MKALILAGGQGKRLEDQTSDKPKALVEVLGKPMLLYQLEALQACNINHIIIVTGYKSEKITEFITHLKKKDSRFSQTIFEFVENKDYLNTNSAYGVWLARNKIEKTPYIHLNCDIIFFSDLLQEVINSPHENVIVIDKRVVLRDNMEQVILKRDKIIKMDNKHFKEALGKAVGIAKFSPRNVQWILEKTEEYIKQGNKNKNYYGIIREAIPHVDFYGLDVKDHFIFEANTLGELEQAHALLAQLRSKLNKL